MHNYLPYRQGWDRYYYGAGAVDAAGLACRCLVSDLADFATWVAYTGAEWRAPEVVAAYLRTLEDGGAAYATITRRLTSIHKLVAIAAFAAGDLDYEDPTNTPGSESLSRRSAAA